MSICHPASEEISDIRVGISEEFSDKTENCVSTKEPDSDLSVIADILSFPEEDEE